MFKEKKMKEAIRWLFSLFEISDFDDYDEEVYDIYAGPFLVVGLTEDNFGSLSPELMEKFEAKFHQPEMFVKMGKGMMVLPIPEESMKVKEHSKGLEPKVKTSPEFGDM